MLDYGGLHIHGIGFTGAYRVLLYVWDSGNVGIRFMYD